MKSLLCFFILLSNVFCQPKEQKQAVNEKEWIGNYYFSVKNRDGLKTSFDINILKLDNITVKYASEGDKPQIYRNI
jgi:hypothetical protein